MAELVKQGQSQAPGIYPRWARSGYAAPRRSSHCGTAKRIFALGARHGSGHPADFAGTGDRPSPLQPAGRGFLTGEIKSYEDIPEDDYRRNDPRYQGENFTKNLALVDVVKDIAQSQDAATGQVALAWLLAQGEDIVPIPGTKRLKYLEENAASVAVSLTAHDLARLDALATQTSGPRYNERGMGMVER